MSVVDEKESKKTEIPIFSYFLSLTFSLAQTLIDLIFNNDEDAISKRQRERKNTWTRFSQARHKNIWPREILQLGRPFKI